MALASGERVPEDLSVFTPAGEEVQLGSVLRGTETLVIFLRHLGCLPCREHLVEVSQRREQLGARPICITFSPPALLAAFEREMGLDIPLYGDPSRAVYHAFGLERASVARVWLDPRVWMRYAKLLARGRRFARIEQDTLQLGGDAVIDAEGRLRWIYRSRGPADRATVDELIAAIRGE